MVDLFKQLRKLLRKSKDHVNDLPADAKDPQAATSESNDRMNKTILTKEVVIDLWRQVEKTREGMYTCAETFALLDEYAELVQSNQDAEKLMPLVKAHLDACPNCWSEFEALITILESELSDEV